MVISRTVVVAGAGSRACAGIEGGGGCSEEAWGEGSRAAVTVVAGSGPVVDSETGEAAGGVLPLVGMAGGGLMVWAAAAARVAACARIRLRNPPDFDFELTTDSSSIALKSPPQPSSFLKKSLV